MIIYIYANLYIFMHCVKPPEWKSFLAMIRLWFSSIYQMRYPDDIQHDTHNSYILARLNLQQKMGYLHETQPRDKHDKIVNSIIGEMNIYNL